MKVTNEIEVEDLYYVSYDYAPFKLCGEAYDASYIKDTLENNSGRSLRNLLQQRSFSNDLKLDLYNPNLNYIVIVSAREIGCSGRSDYRMANTSCSFQCLIDDRRYFGHQLSSIFTIKYLDYDEG